MFILLRYDIVLLQYFGISNLPRGVFLLIIIHGRKDWDHAVPCH